MIGLIVQSAAILTNPPARPREKRSRGKPPPLHLCHSTHAMVMTYEQVSETETRDMMALKPTADPKLMQVMTRVAAITVQRAVCGTSASGTCRQSALGLLDASTWYAHMLQLLRER